MCTCMSAVLCTMSSHAYISTVLCTMPSHVYMSTVLCTMPSHVYMSTVLCTKPSHMYMVKKRRGEKEQVRETITTSITGNLNGEKMTWRKKNDMKKMDDLQSTSQHDVV